MNMQAVQAVHGASREKNRRVLGAMGPANKEGLVGPGLSYGAIAVDGFGVAGAGNTGTMGS